MKVGDMVQYTPHADSPVDAGLGFVVEERRNVGGFLQHKIMWGVDIQDGRDGIWYGPDDNKDGLIVVV